MCVMFGTKLSSWEFNVVNVTIVWLVLLSRSKFTGQLCAGEVSGGVGQCHHATGSLSERSGPMPPTQSFVSTYFIQNKKRYFKKILLFSATFHSVICKVWPIGNMVVLKLPYCFAEIFLHHWISITKYGDFGSAFAADYLCFKGWILIFDQGFPF